MICLLTRENSTSSHKVFKSADSSSALLYPEEGVDSCSQIPKVYQVWAAAVGQLLFTLYVYAYCFSLYIPVFTQDCVCI
jgi:hypothetical protein